MCILTVLHVLDYRMLLAIVIGVLYVLDRQLFTKPDYMLLITFVAFFILVGNIKNMDGFSAFLRTHVGGHELAASIFASQIISNVPAAVLLSGGIDSPVAGYMIAKRGVEIECIHFFSYPYTSERAKEKVLELARIMTRYCGRMTVDVVGFTKVQEAIRDHCREEYFTIIMRRFMMRIAQAIAKDHGAKCLVTGENLGQVASQTMDAMAVTGAVVDIPMFHPLIGMDKEEIVTRARKIGTLETSILPYEDCCTVFTPKHPKTKPVLALVEAEEAKLDVDALVADALANTEKVAIRYYED